LIDLLNESLDNIASIFSLIVGILYAVYWFKVEADRAFSFLTLYLGLTVIINLTMTFYATHKWNNLFISHFYFISQFVLLSQFYYCLFKKKQKQLVRFLQILVLLIIIINFIIDPAIFFKFSLLEVFVTAITLLVFTIIHLYNSLIEKGTYQYVNAGILIYLSMSTLIFFLGNYLALSKDLPEGLSNNIWNINILLVLIYQTFIFLEWKINISKWKTKNP
jgi:hypothetical protein